MKVPEAEVGRLLSYLHVSLPDIGGQLRTDKERAESQTCSDIVGPEASTPPTINTHNLCSDIVGLEEQITLHFETENVRLQGELEMANKQCDSLRDDLRVLFKQVNAIPLGSTKQGSPSATFSSGGCTLDIAQEIPHEIALPFTGPETIRKKEAFLTLYPNPNLNFNLRSEAV